MFDVFGVLGAGAAVVLPEAAARRDPQRWWELLREHEVSVWNSVPALFEMLVTHLENDAVRDAPVPLRLAMLSGDWIPIGLPDRARALAARLEVVSLGGATEAAIWSIAFPVGEVAPDWTAIPYGFPLRNQTFHVLNDRLEPAPVWTAGELFIGGLGLANGYWNDPERTAASFIIHPDSGERLYRTGDLGRYLPDGCIEFLGREDFQVKIGGFRVELGEVEYAITRHPEVATAVAVATGARTQQRLVAYLVPGEVTANTEELVNSIRTHLAETVPAYLIPADFVVLDELPLSSNGKVDRSALPAPEHGGEAGGTEPVGEHLRETLARLLAVAGDVLGVPALGAQDNFFAVGGDSIVGIQLIGRANTTGLMVTPQDLFESSTFLELAQRASQTGPGTANATVSPLSPHQRSLTEASIVGWVATAIRPGTDPDLVERAFQELTLRHAALRVRLGESDDGFTGHYDGEVLVDEVFTEMDLTALPAQAIEQAIDEIVTEMAEEIDPRTTPPVKMALVRTTTGDQLLWLGRAAAVDDPSWQLLLADFARAYHALAERRTVEWDGLAADGAAPLRPGDGLDCAPTGRTALSGWVHTVLDGATVAELRAATFGSYHLGFTEAVAVALAVACRNVPGAPPAISVERPLRTPATRDAVGRLNEVVTVDLGEVGTDPVDVVPAVKREYRRAVPGQVDIPRLHLHEIADADWQPPVGPFVLDGFTGPRQDATTAGTVAEISGAVVSGELRLCWQFTADPAPLTAVAETFADAVRAVVEHCGHSAAGSYEPSDFPLSGLGADELDEFLRALG